MGCTCSHHRGFGHHTYDSYARALLEQISLLAIEHAGESVKAGTEVDVPVTIRVRFEDVLGVAEKPKDPKPKKKGALMPCCYCTVDKYGGCGPPYMGMCCVHPKASAE